MAEFTIHADENTDPGTHALVIGVGRYPHLAGGERPVPDSDGMKQLTSPPISARAVANWLLAEHHDPRRPLASLTLLLSEQTPAPFTNPRTQVAHDVDGATIDDIVTAVRQWKARGDGNVDNRLVFYFCGHGVAQGDDMSLLASDVFADTDNPLNGALDFTSLMKGLKRCRASQQVFFVDACRASSDVLIEQSGSFAGQVPLGPGLRPRDLPRRLHLPYYATLGGDRSHARHGQVSLFTEALLKGLRGAGSDDPEGEWQVTTIRLHEAIDHFMKEPQFAGAFAGVQVPNVMEMPVFDLHQLPGAPIVPVYVGCQEPGANAGAEFVCRQAGLEQLRRAAVDMDGLDDDDDADSEWAIELAFGEYEFEAQLGAQDVRTKSITVRPSHRRVRLAATS